MVQYYWNPNFQQQQQQQQQQMPPTATFPSGGQPGLPQREQSYIENILRLNRGEPGTFHFSFENALETGKNTKEIRGVVEAAGRDHVILSDARTGHRFLMPMIYFDYAEFDNEVKYFNQQP